MADPVRSCAWATMSGSDPVDRGAAPQPAADPARRRPLGRGTVVAGFPRLTIAHVPRRAGGRVGGLLVVHDDPDIRLLLKIMLKGDPRLQEQTEAATAHAAIRLLDTFQPALIVLDHEPQASPMSGLAAARAMKMRAPRAMILLFSTYQVDWHIEQEPSVDALLRKHEIADLAATARRLLG